MSDRERPARPGKSTRPKREVPVDRTKRLNRQQMAFLEALAADPKCNQTQAAIKAGYSPKSATVMGCQLLTDARYAHVQAAWQEMQAKRLEKFQVTAERTIEQLAWIAYGDRRKVAEWSEKGLKVTSSDELWPEEAALVAGIKKQDTPYGTTMQVKWESRVEALRLLMKHLGLLKEHLVVEDYTEAGSELASFLEDLAEMVGEQDEILELARKQLHQHSQNADSAGPQPT